MKKCLNCGREWADDVAFCCECGSALQEYTAEPYAEAEPLAVAIAEEPVQKSKKGLLIALGCTLGALMLVVIIGFFTNWFGLVSPLAKIASGVKETLTAESVTLNMEYTIDDGEDEESDEMEVRLVADHKNEELTLWVDTDAYEGVLYEGKTYIRRDFYASVEEVDVDIYFDFYEALTDPEEVDWEEYIEDAGLEDYVEAEEIEGFIKDFYSDYLCDEEWLEKYLGYEKDGDVYTFNPDYEKLLDELIDIFDESDAFSRKGKKAIKEYLEEGLDLMDDEELETEISFTIQGGKLTKMEIFVSAEGDSAEYIFEFSDIGKTKIDEEEIQDLIDDVETWIDENICPECEERIYEDEYHGDCIDCGDHGDLYDEDYCEDCYDVYYYYDDSDYGFCDICGDYTYLNYWRGGQYCWECY